MIQINVNKPFEVNQIVFKDRDQDPLCDRIVFVAGNFVIVAENESDTAPNWYNADEIKALFGMREMKRKQNNPVFW